MPNLVHCNALDLAPLSESAHRLADVLGRLREGAALPDAERARQQRDLYPHLCHEVERAALHFKRSGIADGLRGSGEPQFDAVARFRRAVFQIKAALDGLVALPNADIAYPHVELAGVDLLEKLPAASILAIAHEARALREHLGAAEIWRPADQPPIALDGCPCGSCAADEANGWAMQLAARRGATFLSQSAEKWAAAVQAASGKLCSASLIRKTALWKTTMATTGRARRPKGMGKKSNTIPLGDAALAVVPQSREPDPAELAAIKDEHEQAEGRREEIERLAAKIPGCEAPEKKAEAVAFIEQNPDLFLKRRSTSRRS